MASPLIRLFGTAILALVLVSVVTTPCIAEATELKAFRPLVGPGERAPAFTLEDVDGKHVSYRPAGGKPALIVFWSAFCPLCRELTPSVNDIHRRYGATLRVVSVNLDGKRFSKSVKSFIKEQSMVYPVLFDIIRGDFFVASDRYGVEKIPTAVLVDEGGKVRAAYSADGIREMVAGFDVIVSGMQKGSGVKE